VVRGGQQDMFLLDHTCGDLILINISWLIGYILYPGSLTSSDHLVRVKHSFIKTIARRAIKLAEITWCRNIRLKYTLAIHIVKVITSEQNSSRGGIA